MVDPPPPPGLDANSASSAGATFRVPDQRRRPATRPNSPASTTTHFPSFGARWYSGHLGQFLSPDPLWYVDAYDLYGYVGFDPVNYWDPSGLHAASLGDATSRFEEEPDQTSSIIPVFFPPIVSGTSSPCIQSDIDCKEPASAALDFMPGVGEAKSFVELGTGRDLVTGEDVSRFVALLGMVPILGNLKGLKVLGNLRGGKGLDIDDLSAAARAPDKGDYTKAGRSLQKHGARDGNPYPEPTGNPEAVNQQGQAIVDEILTNPNSTIQADSSHPRFGDIVEVREPSGRGIRYSQDGEFLHFLDPN